jgi:TolA-binding protein
MTRPLSRARWPAVAALIASLLLGGCRSKVERQYRLAYTLLAENKPELAIAEFSRFVRNHPNDPLAPAAYYQLAFLYRTHVADPQKALEQYAIIADRYPRSEEADDALEWMASIGRGQKDLKLIRDVVARLETRYADRHSACARARIQLALALLDAGSPEAQPVCKSILNRYPDQPNQCAQAQLILGRALEKIGKNQEAAVKQFEQVRKDYPDTTSAVEAQQRIGWIFYRRERSEAGKPAKPVALPKKRVVGVPALVHEEGGGVHRLPLEALAVLLKHRKTDADIDTLMAVSGIAFQFVYDPKQRGMGAGVFATQPLQTTATSFGFVPLESSSSTPEEAMLSLCQTLDRDKPAMVPYGDAEWVVVVGYDQGRKEFIFLRPGKGESTEKFDEFASRWKVATDQTGGALPSFYQFALGPANAGVSSADLVRDAAKRGVSLFLQRTTVFGAPAGTAAYEALISDLDAHAGAPMPADAGDLAAWADEPLNSLRQGRTAAAQFLENSAAGLPAPMSSHARTAAALYRSLAAKLAELHDRFPQPPQSAQTGASYPEYSGAASAAAQTARGALDIDRKAADELSAIASE